MVDKKDKKDKKDSPGAAPAVRIDQYVKNGVHLVQARKLKVDDVTKEIDAIVPVKRFPVGTATQEVLQWIRKSPIELFELLSLHDTDVEGRSAKGLMIIRVTWKGAVKTETTVKVL